MAHLSLSLLGACQIVRDDQPITGLRTLKARGLLVYLAVHAERAHGREALATLLWPEQPGEVARTYLRQALANLREVLDEPAARVPLLLATHGTVQLNPLALYDLDVATFRTLLAACAEHPHRRAISCTACARRLEQAITLYCGSFLDQFYIRDSAPFEEWVVLMREALHQQAVTALAQLATYYERRGIYDTVEHLARRQLVLDPWREEAHQQLIRALALSGQRSAALEQYERCRTILQADLGVEPAAETEELYRKIRVEQLAPKVSPARAIGLPHPTTSFVGREVEEAALLEQLTARNCRLITLLGPPGIGKTRLSLEVAAELVNDFEDGVVFVPLAALREPELVVRTIAATLQVPEVADKSALQRLTGALQTRHLLLVLDNFEQVVGAAVDVAHLLQAAPNLTLLVTSRAPLRLTAEVQFAVPPLTLPDEQVGDAVEQLTLSEAGRLFVARTQSILGAFTLNAANSRAIAGICARLDGLPLAIELAAARIRLLEPDVLLERLGHRLQVLTGGARDLPARHQTLRATMDWSYQLLTPAEQRLFWRLAVFVGGWTLAAAEAVCDRSHLGTEVLDGLQLLLEQCLVQREVGVAGEPRFRRLETIREYALERLDASGEADELQRRHAVYYLALAERAEPALRGPDLLGWLERLEVELDNLRAALAWSLADTGDAEIGVQLAGALGRFWFLRGHFLELERWSAKAIARLDAVPAAVRHAIHAKLLLSRASCAYHLRDLALTAALGEESLVHCQAVGDRWGSVICRVFIGVARTREDREHVRVQLEHSVALSREVGDPWLIAFALEMLAWNGYDDKEPQLLPLCEESLRLARKVGDPWLIAQIRRALAFEVGAQGDYPQATALFEEGLASCESLGAKGIMSWTLVGLELALIHQGDYAAARRRNAERERLEQELGNRGGVQATRWFRGRLDLLEGRFAEALACFEEHLAFTRDTDYTQGIILTLCSLGQVALAQGQVTHAGPLFSQSLRLCCVHSMWRDSVQSLEGVAAFASATDPKRAARLLGAAAAARDEHGCFWEPIIPRQQEWAVAAIHAQLDERSFGAAWAKGRAMTLEQAVTYALELSNPE